ncbi:MAG: hypothetical protein ACI9PC_001648 [Porticoccaceae bacterium]|jgi:hypothetical protein
MLILVVSLLLNRFNLNSRNSSKPPATDPNHMKPSRINSDKKTSGSTLQPHDDPDFIEVLSVDRRYLPKRQYREKGFEVRQVVDIDIAWIVTEYHKPHHVSSILVCRILSAWCYSRYQYCMSTKQALISILLGTDCTVRQRRYGYNIVHIENVVPKQGWMKR